MTGSTLLPHDLATGPPHRVACCETQNQLQTRGAGPSVMQGPLGAGLEHVEKNGRELELEMDEFND
jgi:hypothetical protein